MEKSKELVILPKVARSQLGKFLAALESEGIKTVYLDPKLVGKSKLASIYPSQSAKYVVLEKDVPRPRGKKVGKKI